MMLRASQLSRRVGTIDLFANLSFTIEPGQLVSLVGKSGTGKSSLLEVLALERRPDSGSLVMFGEEVDWRVDPDIAKLKAKPIGFVPQAPNLCEFISVWENLQISLTLAGFDSDLEMARTERVLNTLGLAHKMHERVSAMSGGERYRASFARVLLRNPTVLVCDEPTSALDEATAATLCGLLRRHTEERANAVVVATHDPNLISMSDLVLDLDSL